jgi:hypothetical protein
MITMKKIFILLSFVLAGFVSEAQTLGFPSIDSLSRYNNRYINNSPVEAFANLRLNTLLHGIIWWIDTAMNQIGDSAVTIPGNGGGGNIRHNDTLFIYEVRKDTVWIPLLLNAHNGLTKSLDSVRWGGELDRETTIEQDGNGITFHDGLFTHAWGDYDPGVEDFSVVTMGQNNFTVNLKGSGLYNTAAMTITKVGDIGINMYANSTAYPGGSSVDVLADYVWLFNQDGNIHLDGILDSPQAHQLYYNPTSKLVTYGLAVAGGGGGGDGIGAVYATNGLTNVNDSTVEFGGTLTSNRTISAAGFTTTWSGTYSGAGAIFNIGNTSSGPAFGATNNGGGATGSFTNSGSGNALLLTGASGIPLRSVTTTGSAAGTFQVNPSTTTTVVNTLELNRLTSGTAAAGMGGAVRFNLEADDGSTYLSNRLISKWTTATTASRVSNFQIEGVNAGTTSTIFSLLGNGQLTLNNYIGGAFDGAVIKGLGTDASGNVWTYDVGGASGTGTLTDAENGVSLVGGNTVNWGGPLTTDIEIDQATNDILMRDGSFHHVTGDETLSGGAYSRIFNEDAGFNISNTTGTVFNGITMSRVVSGGKMTLQSYNASGSNSSTIQMGGTLGLILNNSNGNIFLTDLDDSVQSKSLYYNPTNGKVTYSDPADAGGDVTAVNNRIDSLLNNFPAGGAPEDNMITFTSSVTADRTIPAEAILQYVLVNPTTALTAFKVGTAADDDKYVTATPVTSGDYTVFSVEAYIPSSTAIRFSGITSSTQIKLVYKTLHE